MKTFFALIPLLIASASAECDVYENIKKTFEYWETADLTDMEKAFSHENAGYAEDFTVIMGTMTLSRADFLKLFGDALSLSKFTIDVEWIDCAKGQWCLSKVKTTYSAGLNAKEKDAVVSYGQYWTFHYNDECLISHIISAADARDVAVAMEKLSIVDAASASDL
jgi:hypothetical protein